MAAADPGLVDQDGRVARIARYSPVFTGQRHCRPHLSKPAALGNSSVPEIFSICSVGRVRALHKVIYHLTHDSLTQFQECSNDPHHAAFASSPIAPEVGATWAFAGRSRKWASHMTFTLVSFAREGSRIARRHPFGRFHL